MRALSPPPNARPRRFTGPAVAAALLLAVVSIAGIVLPGAADGSSTPAAARAVGVKARPGPLLFIGDSVGASIQGLLPSLLKAGGYKYRYDARSARCTIGRANRCSDNNALGVIADLDASVKPTFAVIELGYNDLTTTFGNGIDKVVQALSAKGVKKIVWINLSERRPNSSGGKVYDDYNAILRAAAKRWPQIIVLDWNRYSSGDAATSWFVPGREGKPDLIHLTALGQKKFANWIRAEVDRLDDAGALPGSSGSGSTTTTTTATTTPRTSRPELKRGDTGAFVVDLQTALVARGAKIAKDGKFGPGTETAVKNFQRSKGLNPDGICGPKTWKALGF